MSFDDSIFVDPPVGMSVRIQNIKDTTDKINAKLTELMKKANHSSIICNKDAAEEVSNFCGEAVDWIEEVALQKIVEQLEKMEEVIDSHKKF